MALQDAGRANEAQTLVRQCLEELERPETLCEAPLSEGLVRHFVVQFKMKQAQGCMHQSRHEVAQNALA